MGPDPTKFMEVVLGATKRSPLYTSATATMLLSPSAWSIYLRSENFRLLGLFCSVRLLNFEKI